MIISIPIKPYLKDFLVNMYGQEPILATKRNFVGIILQPLIQKPPADYIPSHTEPKPDAILINLMRNKKKDELQKNPLYYYYISEDDQLLFNHGISHLFDKIFNMYMDSYIEVFHSDENCFEIKGSIQDFCEKNNLNPDNANYEMLKKKYYRYKKTKKNGAFRPYKKQLILQKKRSVLSL